MLNKPGFDLWSPSVLSDRAVASHHPVTGHDQREGIGGHGRSHCSSRPGGAGHAGQLSVGHCGAVVHPNQSVEYPTIEPVAQPPIQRQIEPLATTLEIFAELSDGLFQPSWVALTHRVGQFSQLRQHVLYLFHVAETDPHQPLRRGGHIQLPNGRVHRPQGHARVIGFG